ncbi:MULTISPECIES: FAD-dependent oxidoreductase [Calothrix]|uniref:NAD(P)/FAD-dependent oxidoreductase n=2 Tax=Calothrix TaxID=1186 RepID=A0ABR8AAC6_9CYAN|nr:MULTISPECIES: NAD(P)/FAD-dependent oxidoreductase [Calothrix]MBD2196833.1 NAD(P)/FAD-dependent oxidoreductase [Calothrix parietina FACHB-288]MBD2225385.1 NAD(P)/FAD-dependent oxidoreductase [Calothrix anomala FACHB-343]
MSKIAVVGAGPAGCSAAYHLARSGHEVTLLDKHAFPKDKVCGDGISIESIQALSMMGIYPHDIRKSASEYAPIDHFFLGVSNQIAHSETTKLQAYCIPRFFFDQLLFAKAIDAGCSFLTQTVNKNDWHRQGLYDAFDTIIDARGVYAGEVNAIAIRAYWLVKRQDLSPTALAEAQIHFDRSLGVNGYGWIFPVSTQDDPIKLNVGVGVWLDEYQKRKTNIIQLFKQFIQNNETARQLLTKVISQEPPKVFPLATAKKGNKVADGKILRIGDAANLTDPLTGEGIANAVLSGFYVAQAINMSSTPDAATDNWQYLYESQFEADLRAGLRIKALRKFSFMNYLLIWLMKQNPRVAQQVSHAVAGVVPYNEVLASLKY